MMIVVVTGGRTYSDLGYLTEVLDEVHQERAITEIRNGGMIGADALSSYWAYQRMVDTDCVGAKWGQYGYRAGPIRNRIMLANSPLRQAPELVVAFPGGRGTTNCVNEASRLGIEVLRA